MIKRIKYSLYRQSYSDFPATDYDAKTKTIAVDLPDVNTKFPNAWKKSGNALYTPGGCAVRFWNTGLAQNYVVETLKAPLTSKTIPAGIDSKAKVIQTVRDFEKLMEEAIR